MCVCVCVAGVCVVCAVSEDLPEYLGVVSHSTSLSAVAALTRGTSVGLAAGMKRISAESSSTAHSAGVADDEASTLNAALPKALTPPPLLLCPTDFDPSKPRLLPLPPLPAPSSVAKSIIRSVPGDVDSEKSNEDSRSTVRSLSSNERSRLARILRMLRPSHPAEPLSPGNESLRSRPATTSACAWAATSRSSCRASYSSRASGVSPIKNDPCTRITK